MKEERHEHHEEQRLEATTVRLKQSQENEDED